MMTAPIDLVGNENTRTADDAATVETRLSAKADEPPSDEPRSRIRVPTRCTAVVALIVTLGRMAFSLNRFSFSIGPDELATAGMGRFLAGHEFNMLATGTYRPGLSVLLAPLFMLTDDPDSLVRLGLAVNALIGGAAAFWLVPIVRRLTRFGELGALVTSGMLLLTPAALEASAHVWAEPLVMLTFLATLLAVLRYHDVPNYRTGVAALLWAVAGYTAHGRLLPLVVIALLAVVGRALCDRRFWLAGALAAVGIGATIASSGFQDWVVANVWEFPGTNNTADSVVKRLGDPLQILDSSIGQLWYQLSASALLFGFGLIELIRRVASSDHRAHRQDATIVLGMTVPLMGVSMVFMSDRVRADHVIYGRYNDAIVLPLLAVGAWWVVEGRRDDSIRQRRFIIGSVVTGTVAIALLLRQLHYIQLSVGGVEPMIAGIVPATWRGVVNVLGVTTVALAVFGLILTAGRMRGEQRWVTCLAGAVVLLAAGARLWMIDAPSANSFVGSASVTAIRELDLAPEPGETIGVSVMPDEYGPDLSAQGQVLQALGYQWYVPEYRFVFDNGPSDDVGPYVFATTNDALLTREGGRVLWEDPLGGMALWLEPLPKP